MLLLDEPSAGLAQREAEALAELLAELRGALGAALLVIDHDLPLVLGLADRIVVLEHGRVVEDGCHDSLLQAGGRYAEMYTLQASRFWTDADG